jgi:hypothetical protein
MKNIYILSTDKPTLDGVKIYITSDKEIKANVYCLINKVLCKTELLDGRIVSRQLVDGGTMDICKSEYLEIILTTDQDLIKDGVQAIDDEFLEWFVNNPSCEKVLVTNLYDDFNPIEYFYESIIPKEEPKQETLEEVAKRLIFKTIGGNYGLASSDEYDQVDGYFDTYLEAFLTLKLKLQQQGYSEEEVLEQLNILMSLPSSTLDKFTDKNGSITKEWFEQFKKK